MLGKSHSTQCVLYGYLWRHPARQGLSDNLNFEPLFDVSRFQPYAYASALCHLPSAPCHIPFGFLFVSSLRLSARTTTQSRRIRLIWSMYSSSLASSRTYYTDHRGRRHLSYSTRTAIVMQLMIGRTSLRDLHSCHISDIVSAWSFSGRARFLATGCFHCPPSDCAHCLCLWLSSCPRSPRPQHRPRGICEVCFVRV